jgi:hypothetical protein
VRLRPGQTDIIIFSSAHTRARHLNSDLAYLNCQYFFMYASYRLAVVQSSELLEARSALPIVNALFETIRGWSKRDDEKHWYSYTLTYATVDGTSWGCRL